MNTETPEFTPFHDDTKRDALRAKIEAGERRIAQRDLASDAREAAQAAADYARANPGKVVAGALVIGLVIGLLTAPGRRAASNAAARVTGRKRKVDTPSKVAAFLSHTVMTRGMELLEDVLEKANLSRERLDDIAEETVTTARRLGHEAAETSDGFARRTRQRAETAARDIADRLRH
jgi:hypothetical protein